MLRSRPLPESACHDSKQWVCTWVAHTCSWCVETTFKGTAPSPLSASADEDVQVGTWNGPKAHSLGQLKCDSFRLLTRPPAGNKTQNIRYGGSWRNAREAGIGRHLCHRIVHRAVMLILVVYQMFDDVTWESLFSRACFARKQVSNWPTCAEWRRQIMNGRRSMQQWFFSKRGCCFNAIRTGWD